MSTETPQISNPVSPIDVQAKPIPEQLDGPSAVTESRDRENVLTGHTNERESAGDIIDNMSPAISDQAEAGRSNRISKTAPDVPEAEDATPGPYDLEDAGSPGKLDEPRPSAARLPPKEAIKEIKMMDTITFEKNFQPMQWIFTDLLGRIQYKEISTITVNEVIKAFLINLNHNQKQEFENDDLL